MEVSVIFCGETEKMSVKSQHKGRQQRLYEATSDEFSVFVRYNKAASIIHKVRKREGTLEIASPHAFGISTNVRGKSRRTSDGSTLHASDGTTFLMLGKLPN